MTEATHDPRGRFLWYDLVTTDPTAATAFYGALTGWGTQLWENSGGAYTMWTVGESPIGGVMTLTEEMRAAGVPPHWMAYVHVPDTDAAAARAEARGGRVVLPPTDIPNVGRFAVITDPQGAAIALFTPANAPATPLGAPRLGDFTWRELVTSDHAGAMDFYADLFGWEKTDSFDMGEMGVYQMYGQHGTTYGGMFSLPADAGVPPSWLYYVRVPDVDRAAAQITALGGTVINGPMEVPGGDRIVQGRDPQGAMFALHATQQGA